MAGRHSRWAGPLFDGHVCSVGYQVIDWIVEYTCHGIGDIQGEPFADAYDLDDEERDHIIEAYRIDEVTGRRLFNEVVYSRPKGRAKSEKAALIVLAEAFAEVRFDGWGADGQPVARPVRSPLIKCLATEEGQAGNTFANVAFIAGEWGQDVHPEVYGGVAGISRYQSARNLYLPQGGEIRACTSGSASKDGGLETHVVADETHLYTLRELRDMYATIARNLGKRFDADPWLHQTSTAYRPGEQSVFEETLTLWRKGELPPSVFVNHREARGRIDLSDKERTLRQLREAYGPAAAWIDLDRKYRDMRDPRICPDTETAARYFLNRPMSSRDAWIAKDVHEAQTRPRVVDPLEPITIGFDGSVSDDSTVLRGCCLSDGYRFKIGVWEKPAGREGIGWKVPRLEVLAAIRKAHAEHRVVRGYYDPHEWRSDIETLAGEFGDEVVVEFPTNSDQRMHNALDRLHTDLVNGVTWHDDDPVAAEHYGNAYVRMKSRYRLVRKEHPNSSRKIDSVVGDALAYEARADLLEGGWTDEPEDTRVFCFR